jgi:P4 family phage/plasmid primase-like protien
MVKRIEESEPKKRYEYNQRPTDIGDLETQRKQDILDGVKAAMESNKMKASISQQDVQGFIVYLQEGNIGLANAFLASCTMLKITTIQGDGYLWSNSEKLWKKAHSLECKSAVINVLRKLLGNFSDHSQIVNNKDNQELFRTAIGKIRSGSIKATFEEIIVKLLDPKFEDLIDLADHDSVPLRGGMLMNLETAIVRERTKKDLFSFEWNVEYLYDHPCTNATRFFNQLFVNSPELVNFACELLGYCITGYTTEKAIFYLYGEGNNGKTALMEILRDIIGSHYGVINSALLLKQRQQRDPNAPSPALMAVKGKRICCGTETNADQEIDEAILKKLVGSDTLEGRHLHKETVEFRCHAKLLLPTNNIPKYNANIKSVGPKIKCLPFLAYFTRTPNPDNPREYLIDDNFVRELRRSHLSEMFTLIARGAQRWYKNGQGQKERGRLIYPTICDVELKKLVDAQDLLLIFITEKCQVGDTDDKSCRIKCSDFYDRYSKWCVFGGNLKPKRDVLRIEMQAKGHGIIKSSVEHYKGIKFITEDSTN